MADEPTETIAADDIRTLIPRVRRAIDGPGGAIVTDLSDSQLTAFIADCLSTVIFLTEGAFGHTLTVTTRDANYGAPTGWTVDPVLSEEEGTLVAAQAALDTFYYRLRDMKTQETIRDEAREWSYTLGTTLVRDQMDLLRSMRDRALEIVLSQADTAAESYVSFISIRDADSSTLIEDFLS